MKVSLISPLVVATLVTVCLTQVPPFTEKCETGLYPPPPERKVGWEVVNLDLPPAERWRAVLKDKAPTIKNLLAKFKQFIIDISGGSKIVIDLVDNDLGWLVDTLPNPYRDEIKGIANITGIPLGEVALYNLFYEVFTVCTSVIAQDSHGKMYHARNLDFGLFLGWNMYNDSWIITDALRPAIVQLDFQKGGKTVFKAVNFAGYVGILTAVRPNKFTLSMNERFNINGGYLGIIDWILGDHKTWWMGFLTRFVMESAKDYDNAKDLLTNTPMLAPAYFILGGTKGGQGCVITRARDKAEDIWEMGTQNSTFFILETNYDHWKAPFFLDDRRTPGYRCMNKLTQNGVSTAGIFNVLSSKPVLNKLTTYTAVMQVDAGSLETYLQYCPDPCYPF